MENTWSCLPRLQYKFRKLGAYKHSDNSTKQNTQHLKKGHRGSLSGFRGGNTTADLSLKWKSEIENCNKNQSDVTSTALNVRACGFHPLRHSVASTDSLQLLLKVPSHLHAEVP